MLAQPPGVGLVARQTRAVNAALLTGAHANSLAVLHVAHGIALRVLQCDKSHDHVDLRRRRNLLVLGDHVGQQFLVDLEIVAALLEGDAEDVLQLGLGRHVVRVDLHHVETALALGLQNLQRLIGVARSDNAVGHLFGQIASHVGIAHVRQRRPVAVGAQAVGTASANVGAGDGRQLALLLHEVHGAISLRQRMAHGRPGGAHVLEGRGRRQTRGLLQLFHQLPGIESVQEVDIAGLAVQHLNGQVAAVLHENARRLLIRVATVLEFQFVHGSP